mmetsp:Transcript_7844/g.15027  ORF Transcript_7844/g.15027 Transcript_7844/m.15027 type:complete len:234 (+) Transcript_7844:11251-11952(+)
MKRILLNWTRNVTSIGLVVLSSRAIPHLYPVLRPRAHKTIVADGAANSLVELVERLGVDYMPTMITGDFDSITQSTAEFFREIPVIHNPSQDNTDFEKCLDLLSSSEPYPIIVIGDVSRRVDHSIAILSALFKPAYSHLEIFLVDSDNLSFTIKPGENELLLAPVQWQYCSLLPIYKPAIVTSSGLHWNLDNQEMSMAGLVSSSNRPDEEVVRVKTSEAILWSCYCEDFLIKK